MKKEEKKRRYFGGKFGITRNDFNDKHEMAHEKRHLEAYLRGDKNFRNGRNADGTPKYYQVLEEWR